MQRHLLGLVFMLLPIVSAAHAPPPLDDQLLKITQALVDAIPKGDKSVWENALTDKAIVVDEFGRITGKADSIASLHPFPPGFSGSIELRQPRVEQYGDSAVLLVEEYERETVFSQQFVVRYQSLLTFVRQSGNWKIAGYEAVTIPTAPPRLDVAGLDLHDYVGTYSYAPGHAWNVSVDHGALGYATHQGGQRNVLQPLAKDVFMGSDDERNVLIFRRNAQGKVDLLIERRKFNDFRLSRAVG